MNAGVEGLCLVPGRRALFSQSFWLHLGPCSCWSMLIVTKLLKPSSLLSFTYLFTLKICLFIYKQTVAVFRHTTAQLSPNFLFGGKVFKAGLEPTSEAHISLDHCLVYIYTNLCLCVYMWTTCVPGAHGGQRGYQIPGTGTTDRCGPPCGCCGRTAGAFNYWAIFPVQNFVLLTFAARSFWCVTCCRCLAVSLAGETASRSPDIVKWPIDFSAVIRGEQVMFRGSLGAEDRTLVEHLPLNHKLSC